VDGDSDAPGDVHGSTFPDALVVLDGVETSSDSRGAFSVAGVDEEYDLIVVVPRTPISSGTAFVLEGLTTRTPVIGFNVARDRYAIIRGEVLGASSPTEAELGFFADSGDLLAQGSSSGSNYSLRPEWLGPPTLAGTLYVLERDPESFAMTGFGQRALTLRNGILAGGDTDRTTNIAVTAIEQMNVSGTVKVPKGLALQALDVQLLHTSVDCDPTAGAREFSCEVPRIVGPPLVLAATAEGLDGGSASSWQPVPSTGQVDVSVPRLVTLLAPEVGAGIDHETQFQFSPPPSGSVAQVVFNVGNWVIYRYTTASASALPDLSAYGVDLPSRATGFWSVDTYAPADTLEAALALQDRYARRDVTLTELAIARSLSRELVVR
jgi:hypothetical protein